MKKVLKQGKIVEHCDSIISEIPILTAGQLDKVKIVEISDSVISILTFLYSSQLAMTGCSQNRDHRYKRIRNFQYLYLV